MSTANTTNRAYGAITLGTLLPWVIGAIILLVMPILMGSKGQLTIMSQMSIMVVFALAYNMLLGWYAVIWTCRLHGYGFFSLPACDER